MNSNRKPRAGDAAASVPAHSPSAAPRRGRRIAAAVAGVVLVAIAGVWLAQRFGPAPAPTAPAANTVAARYVGGKACAECHAKAADAWHGSRHDLAMQVADEKSVLGNFAGARFTYAGTTSTFSRRDGRFVVTTDGPDGKLHDYDIKYTFGVAPLQQYLIEFPGGRMQALGIAWDSRPKKDGGGRWFHLYPGQNIKAGDPLHWTAVNQNWNYMCAECHSTNLRKNFDPASNEFRTAWSELNVSCEACHGPGSNHVAWARTKHDAKDYSAAGMGLALALDERKGVTWQPVATSGNAQRSTPRATAREVEMCARCHARASRISDDYVHGKPPLDTHRLSLLDDDLYWNDGQMRDEVYNWGSFVQSRMYAQGVTCSDCHDPHTLEVRAAGNALCARCHQPAKYDAPAHTHHAAGTPGASCPACHMPTTTYMVIDPRHDHSLRVPRPDLSARLGMPNACNNCHPKQSAQWAADAIHKWTGRTPIGFQNFAEALHAGSEGTPGARGALLAIIDDKAQPGIVRASAISRLGHWLTPTTTEAASRALNDPDSVVRLAAVEALGNGDAAVRQRFLPRMLTDPVRAVRIEAARALAGASEAGLAPPDRKAFDQALAEYVAVQKYSADRPEGRVSLGNLYASRGDPGGAIHEYRKALELDPSFVAGYANLADLYRARDADGEAEAVLRQGIARVPGAAALHYALGLTLVRQKKTPEALREFAQAVKQEAGNPRYAYVYAVGLNDSGRLKDALLTLDAARKRHPYDRDVLTASAYYTARAGNRDAALGYAKTLRELDPENPDYARLVTQIETEAAR
jgi:tetratricopeptide (TPR) repeat protein